MAGKVRTKTDLDRWVHFAGDPERPGPSFEAFSASLPPVESRLPWTGERCTRDANSEVLVEHYHRYAIAQRFAYGKTVLDIACGEGYGSWLLSRVASKVTGLDSNEASVLHARRSYVAPNLFFDVADAEKLHDVPGPFDLVVSFETLEHIVNQEAFLEACAGMLSPTGVLLISSPDREVYRRGEEPNPFHKKELSRAEYVRALQKHFQHVSVLDQVTVSGSLIHSDTARTWGGAIAVSAEDQIALASSVRKAPYLIALASRRPIDSVPASFCADLISTPTGAAVQLEMSEKLSLLTRQWEELRSALYTFAEDAILQSNQIETGSNDREVVLRSGLRQVMNKVIASAPVVSATEQQRIERVETVWGRDLPAEVELQWSKYPMSHPVVRRALNIRATGSAMSDAYTDLPRLIAEHASFPIRRAAGLCCGAGGLDIRLSQMKLFEECVAIDLASRAIDAARRAAAEAGVTNVRFDRRDLIREGMGVTDLDLVYAHQGIHHIDELETFLDSVVSALRPGGLLHLHEFVGPDRFQWSDLQLDEMNHWLASLPDHYKVTTDGHIKDKVGRPTIAEMMAWDPTESVRSSAILPLVSERFDIVEKRLLGGNLHMMALSSIAHNFKPDDPEATRHLEVLLDREMELIEGGLATSDFVVLLAIRR